MLTGSEIDAMITGLQDAGYTIFADEGDRVPLAHGELREVFEVMLLIDPDSSHSLSYDLDMTRKEIVTRRVYWRAVQQKQCPRFNPQCDCYIPGVAEEDYWCRRVDGRGLRPSGEYTKWRAAVLERDSFVCASCGGDGSGDEGPLHAHHICSFKAYPEQRLTVENGLTLCKTCHREIHKRPDNERE